MPLQQTVNVPGPQCSSLLGEESVSNHQNVKSLIMTPLQALGIWVRSRAAWAHAMYHFLATVSLGARQKLAYAGSLSSPESHSSVTSTGDTGVMGMAPDVGCSGSADQFLHGAPTRSVLRIRQMHKYVCG